MGRTEELKRTENAQFNGDNRASVTEKNEINISVISGFRR